jgi:sugar transferase (PEP-CTERM system associated)
LIRLLNAHFPARTLFLGISEACLVTIAFLIATIVRLGDSDAALMLRYEQGFLKIVLVSGVVMACMYYFDLYDSSILSNRREVLTRIIQVLGSVCVLLAILYYVYPPLELGRGIFLIGFALLTTLLFLWRRLFLTLNVLPRFAERTLVLGDGPLAEPLVRELNSRPELGLTVVGHLSKATDQDLSYNGGQRPAGAVEFEADISGAVKSLRATRIVITMGDRRGALPVELLLSLKGGGVQIQDGTDIYEAITGKVPVESLRLGWLLFSPGFHISRFLQIYKRCASLAVSVTGLLLSLPLIPFVALAVKLTSPGPLLYRQNRVGRGGRVFECYKVRTMRADAEADLGPTWAGDEDPRITRVGRFLRRTRIDEIPQLWNVLRGDMTLVGPRPERPEFVELLAKAVPHYNLRHTIRPGITGWAQIRYKYGSSIEDATEKLRYDLFYVKNISPGLDLLIFLETIKTILWRRGAK